MKIIALSGRARHGKDTAAECLKANLEEKGKRVLITHYADLLKYICASFFGWNGEKDESGRELLQKVGTNVVRKQCPDYWVNFIISILDFFGNEWDYVIIGDARFPNEIYKLKEHGFDVVHARVVRENFESELTGAQKNHASETALDEYPVDVWLPNSTLEEFEKLVRMFASNLILEETCTKPEQLTIFDRLPLAEGA